LVLFCFYDRANAKLEQCGQQLAFEKTIGLAIRISEDLPEVDKVAAKREIISCLSHEMRKMSIDSGQQIKKRRGDVRQRESSKFKPDSSGAE
jgi:hypothetical protein